ncbi:MAG: AraC family transcriptional regulator [Clostridia bacterium]|nr:AraC family transcriptional regulator [Clostridia bacterium]
MNSGMQKIEELIESIEANITSDIDYEALASRMALSVYEFRRIFSFIVGCPLSEYIRKRRLSLAACELMRNTKASIQEISETYGYSTSAAFSKAFSEYHGISPTACQRGAAAITLFPRPKFEWHVHSASEHTFQIVQDTDFMIRGYCALSDDTDTCCCEQVWHDFYELGKDQELSGNQIFVSYASENGKVKCRIGDRDTAYEKSAPVDRIPACRWLSVKMNTTDDDIVNQKYNMILYDLLPSAKLTRRSDLPTVEIYPRDMSEEHFEWEIRIPIE